MATKGATWATNKSGKRYAVKDGKVLGGHEGVRVGELTPVEGSTTAPQYPVVGVYDAPDFQQGFNLEFWSGVRRDYLRDVAQSMNGIARDVAQGKEGAPKMKEGGEKAFGEGLQTLDKALRWVARWSNVVAFRDQVGQPYRVQTDNGRRALGTSGVLYLANSLGEKYKAAVAREQAAKAQKR